jgi:hypothetical protein
MLMTLEFFRRILEKYANWKSDENPFQWGPSSMRVDGRTDRQETDTMKLIFAFRNFANAPKNGTT